MPIARVQGPKRGCLGNSSSLSLTLDATPKFDNLLVAVIGTYGSYAPYVYSISQDNVAWSRQVESHNDSLYGRRVEIWAGVVSADASSNLTITLASSGSGSNSDPIIADVCEYQGLQTTNFLDKTATTTGVYTRTLETGYTPTTTRANELCVGGIFNVCNQGNGEDIDPDSRTNNFDYLLDGLGEQYGGQTKSLTYLEKVVSTTGIWWSGCYGGSYTTYEAYAGCMATFKGTVNNDCHLYDSSKWEVDVWREGTHDPASNNYNNIGNSTGYTKYDATSQSVGTWGNTEYEQGYDPWRYTLNGDQKIFQPWGSTWYVGSVVLNTPNQKITYRAKLDELDVQSGGEANAYLNLWIFFPQQGGAGWYNYKYGEIEIYIHRSNHSTPDQTPFAELRHDPTDWYFVGYHATNLSSNYTDFSVDLTAIINKFYTEWGVDLSTGAIAGITFGTECQHAKMKATFDYVKYQY